MFGYGLRTAVAHWKAMRQFVALPRSFRTLVFYSEGPGDWPHLGPVIERLLHDHDAHVTYLTSGSDDPGLQLVHERFRTFDIGAGTVRTVLFRCIDCTHFVMTLPDLERFHLKRSVHPVHYVYLFHSLNSMHTIYRQGALDAYDTILCAGPHHVEEIRATEAAYGLRAKQLVEHGSTKLDSVLAQVRAPGSSARPHHERTVLVAPTWGESSLIEQPVGQEMLDILVRAGYRTVLRLHPMTGRRQPALVRALRQKYGEQSGVTLEEDMNATESWLRSDVMISDWSGAALEYAFALQKPVVFINTPPKVNNPEWERIAVRPFEEPLRI